MSGRPLDVRLLLVADPGRAMLRLTAALDVVPSAWGAQWSLRPVAEARRAPRALRGHALVLASVAGAARRVGAAGCAADPADALRRAMWELRERQAAATFAGGGEVRLCSHADLTGAGRRALHPDDLRGRPLVPGQWPYPAWDAGTALPWIPAADLADGGRVWVPLFLVGLRRDVPGGHRTEVTSIGLAGGPDESAATAAARRELLERDRLVRAWRHGQPLRREDARRDGEWEIAALGGTTSARHPLAVVVQHDAAAGLLGIGSAAHPDAAEARRHAEAEAAQLATLAWLRRGRLPPPAAPAGFPDRVGPGRTAAAILARLTTAAQGAADPEPPAPVPPRLDPAARGLAAAVRLTESGDPVVVCRVIATDVEPMEAAHACARSRPGSVPAHLDPHPFG